MFMKITNRYINGYSYCDTYNYFLGFHQDGVTKAEEDFKDENLDKIYNIFKDATKLYPIPKSDKLKGHWIAQSKYARQNNYLIEANLRVHTEPKDLSAMRLCIPFNTDAPEFSIELKIPTKLLQFKPGIIYYEEKNLPIYRSTAICLFKKIDEYIVKRLLEENIIVPEIEDLYISN